MTHELDVIMGRASVIERFHSYGTRLLLGDTQSISLTDKYHVGVYLALGDMRCACSGCTDRRCTPGSGNSKKRVLRTTAFENFFEITCEI